MPDPNASQAATRAMPGDDGYKPFQPGVTAPEPEFEISDDGLSDGITGGTGATGTEGSEQPAAQSDQLGEEYKPYSQFPWDKVPADVRQEFLSKVKQFHGDMSRNQNELGELRKRATESGQKAQWFDELAGQKWFLDAYMRQQGGGAGSNGATATDSAAAEKAQLEKLAEFGIDRNATDILKTAMRGEFSTALAPFQQQLEYLQRSIMDRAARDELAEVRKFAAEKGLPSPDEIVPKLTQLIQSGEAKNVWGAFKIATFEDAQASAERRAKATVVEDLQRKSATTLPPYSGPASTPSEEQYTGRDGVLRALKAAVTEQRTRMQGR